MKISSLKKNKAMKVLIVDDDKLMLEAISFSLKGDGCEVLIAEDGCKALNILEKETIDLIVSDIMMPTMSGLGLLNLLKQYYFNRIPVIIISSLDKGDVILCSLGLGAENFIAKPINFKELSTRVKKYMNK